MHNRKPSTKPSELLQIWQLNYPRAVKHLKKIKAAQVAADIHYSNLTARFLLNKACIKLAQSNVTKSTCPSRQEKEGKGWEPPQTLCAHMFSKLEHISQPVPTNAKIVLKFLKGPFFLNLSRQCRGSTINRQCGACPVVCTRLKDKKAPRHHASMTTKVLEG